MAATDRRVGGVDDAVERLGADRFDLPILGGQLKAAVDTHMDPGERVKAVRARQRAEQTHAVTVALPDGTVRILEPGETTPPL